VFHRPTPQRNRSIILRRHINHSLLDNKLCNINRNRILCTNRDTLLRRISKYLHHNIYSRLDNRNLCTNFILHISVNHLITVSLLINANLRTKANPHIKLYPHTITILSIITIILANLSRCIVITLLLFHFPRRHQRLCLAENLIFYRHPALILEMEERLLMRKIIMGLLYLTTNVKVKKM
jgi:hypothetical protein